MDCRSPRPVPLPVRPENFGGVEQASFFTHPSRVERPGFIENVGALLEKLPIFGKTQFEWRKVQYQCIRDHLPKIWDERHVECKRISQSHFHVHSTVVGCCEFVSLGNSVCAEIGKQAEPQRRINVRYAAKDSSLIQEFLSWIHGVPNTLFSQPTQGSVHIHSPSLFCLLRKAEGHPRDAKFSGPPG